MYISFSDIPNLLHYLLCNDYTGYLLSWKTELYFASEERWKKAFNIFVAKNHDSDI